MSNIGLSQYSIIHTAVVVAISIETLGEKLSVKLILHYYFYMTFIVYLFTVLVYSMKHFIVFHHCRDSCDGS